MSDQEPPQNPPPPPEGPPPEGYEQEGYTPEQQGLQEEEVFETQSGPAVSATANKNVILIIGGVAVAGFLLYQIFSGDGDEVVAPPPPTTTASDSGASVAPVEELPLPAAPVEPPPLPPPPPIDNNAPVEPAPLPPPPPEAPDIDFSGAGPTNEELQRRRASQMLIMGGSSTSTEEDDPTQRPGVTSAAERAVATQVGDLHNLVLQGKVISAVLETALDTTLPGPLRAIVSHDVYAEAGYDVLIPKGSRLIGTYNTDIVRGQGRVFIIWNRLIRPDGTDIQLNSQAVDNLGRSGIAGFVDNRFFEIFSGSILTSIFSIGLAAATEEMFDTGQVNQTQNTDGSTTTNSTPTAQAAMQATQQLGQIAQQTIGGLLDTRPNITVDQGTPMKVFVNRDLEFPDEEDNGVRIIQ